MLIFFNRMRDLERAKLATRKFFQEILSVPDALCQFTKPMLPLISKYY